VNECIKGCQQAKKVEAGSREEEEGEVGNIFMARKVNIAERNIFQIPVRTLLTLCR
jgi:hypothetical protein